MKGSKSVKERLKILENVEKIIFVSEWVRERFFLDIDQKLKTKNQKLTNQKLKKLKSKNQKLKSKNLKIEIQKLKIQKSKI